MDYITWFQNYKLALHTLGKSHMIMVYNSFLTLLNFICSYIIEDVLNVFIS